VVGVEGQERKRKVLLYLLWINSCFLNLYNFYFPIQFYVCMQPNVFHFVFITSQT
jgi:hypothetical protein